MTQAVPPQRAARPAAPPAPLSALIYLVNHPSNAEALLKDLRRSFKPFPEGCSAITVWQFLLLSGMGMPYAPGAEQLAATLRRMGWRLVPASQPPKAGDVFVTVTDTGALDHVGIVAKEVLNGDWFAAADCLMTDGRTYRRAIAGGEHAPVAYWLRRGG